MNAERFIRSAIGAKLNVSPTRKRWETYPPTNKIPERCKRGTKQAGLIKFASTGTSLMTSRNPQKPPRTLRRRNAINAQRGFRSARSAPLKKAHGVSRGCASNPQLFFPERCKRGTKQAWAIAFTIESISPAAVRNPKNHRARPEATNARRFFRSAIGAKLNVSPARKRWVILPHESNSGAPSARY